MIEHLKSIAVFVEVVRAGQFRAAADRLKITPSAVSYHIRTLEEAIGTPLLYRSTRRIKLTASGATLLQSAETMLDAAETGFSAAQPRENGLSGVLRITLTTALSHSFISKCITRYSVENPNVDIHLHYDNRETDLVAEGFDIALRIGKLRDSSLLCRHLWDIPRMLVACPEFEKKHGPFHTLDDLRNVPWIRFTGIESRRTIIAADGTKSQVEQTGNLSVNSIESMVDLTLNGGGISSPPKHFVEGKLAAGDLVQCLPDSRMIDLPVYAIWHPSAIPNPLVKEFIGFLSDRSN